MRIVRVLLKQYKHPKHLSARTPQDPNKVPFKAILQPQLKDRVSGKVDAISQVECLHEMSVLFAALRDTEFNEKNCTREIEALNKAHVAAMNKAREDKLKNAGQITTTGRELNSKQLNKYLRKFPQPK